MTKGRQFRYQYWRTSVIERTWFLAPTGCTWRPPTDVYETDQSVVVRIEVAGVTIATALASLFTGRRVRDEVGMTGEITLRGKVLPVGGIKEKVLAAHRAGLSTVILPRHNEKDLDELPEKMRTKLTFVLADTVDEVFKEALKPLLNNNRKVA